MKFRKLELNDDLSIVSELIYESDKYIYPTLFDNVEKCKKIMPHFIKGETLFNYKNIYIAEDNNKILGVVVIMKEFLLENHDNMKNIILKNNFILNNFEWVNKEYFETLNFDFKGIYITNVAVLKNFRHNGIGTFMMNNLPNETYSLAAVKDNENAVNMYLKSGFKILYEYDGFKKIRCVEMVRYKV